MVYAIVIFIVFTLLIRFSILYKTFYIKADIRAPLCDEAVFNNLKKELTSLRGNGVGVYIGTLGVKIRLKKAIRNLLLINEHDSSLGVSRLINKLKSLYEVINVCSCALYRVCYPAFDVPRLYRICADISERSVGELLPEKLKVLTSEIFSSELYDYEKNTFNCVLALCYIDIAARSALKAVDYIKNYLRGQGDGAMRKIDLLSIDYGAYSSGVVSVLAGDELNEYTSLAAANSVDLSAVSDKFFMDLSTSVAGFICAYRSALVAVNADCGAEDYGIKVFGGETEYKQNVLGRAVTASTDNRGKFEINLSGKIIPIEITCGDGGDTISLSSCDGIMTGGRTVYHGAREGIELSAQIVSPPDMCAAIVRITVVNRSDQSVSVNLSVMASIDGKVISPKNNAVHMLGDGYVGFYSDEDFTGGAYDLSPFEKRVVNASIVFGSKYAVNSKGKLSLSFGSFERADTFCAVYRILNGSFVCGNAENADILSGVEYYGADKKRVDNTIERADTEFGYCDNVYRTAPDSGLINTAFDGESELYCRADGVSAFKHNDRELYNNAVVIVEEDGNVFSPSFYPCGVGKTCTEFLNGKTVYKTVFNGLECTLERFIAARKSAERFTVTVKNNTARRRNLYAMLSVETCGKCVPIDNGVTSEYYDGGYITAVTREEVFECALYKEGYFKHGRIDRAHGFRTGGIISAPTVSVKLSVPPRGSSKTDFALFYSLNPPTNSQAESILRRVDFEPIPNVDILVEPKTSDKLLNAVYLRARYLVFSGLSGGAESDIGDECEAVELLKLARILYSRDNFDSALRALMSGINKVEESGLLYRGNDESFVVARLIYGIVTENFFGLKIIGDVGYVYPQIGACPFSVAYEVKSNACSTFVNIDCSEKCGEWVIKQGIVTRSCGAVKFEGGQITVVRDGKTRSVGFLGADKVK
ncbi:MAG: hypothetical protein J1F33_00205 [Clostridiales bacterium]|nr:hypothetical protein [Clostridiales bacterium]